MKLHLIHSQVANEKIDAQDIIIDLEMIAAIQIIKILDKETGDHFLLNLETPAEDAKEVHDSFDTLKESLTAMLIKLNHSSNEINKLIDNFKISTIDRNSRQEIKLKEFKKFLDKADEYKKYTSDLTSELIKLKVLAGSKIE
jgi:hypothetical protein